MSETPELSSPTFAPRRVTSASPTFSPTRSPDIGGSDEEESGISSPTFAPRKLGGVGNTIFRLEHTGSSSDMFNAAIKSHRVDATGLMKARTQMRSVSASELQNVVTHGKSTPAMEGPRGEARFKYEHGGLVCITDEEGKHAISCWKNITTYPKASTQYETKLIYACRPGHHDLLTAKAMIEEHGVSPNITCSKGHTPLMRAVQNVYGSVDCADAALLKYLLSVPGVDIDYPSEEGNRSALHWSVLFGSPTAVKLLLGAGACPFVQDADGKTPAETVSDVVLADSATGTESTEARRAAIAKLLVEATEGYDTALQQDLASNSA